MTMTRDEQRRFKELLKRFIESNEPLMGNIAVFFNEHGELLYSGIIEEWPKIIAVDREWGKVQEMDASQPPFAGRTVKFYSMLTGN